MKRAIFLCSSSLAAVAIACTPCPEKGSCFNQEGYVDPGLVKQYPGVVHPQSVGGDAGTIILDPDGGCSVPADAGACSTCVEGACCAEANACPADGGDGSCASLDACAINYCAMQCTGLP